MSLFDSFCVAIGQALLGWLIADLFSGVFHWWEDRVGNEAMPIIGPQIVVPNRLHHTDPLAFTYGSVARRNKPLWAMVALISGLWLWATGPTVMWATATVGGLVVNEVHRLAHRPLLAGPVSRLFQEIGLFQSPKHHAGHHRAPSDTRYCILTDWLNPVLDRLRIWEGLEACLGGVGLEPNRGTA
jgi:hypothetical protein